MLHDYPLDKDTPVGNALFWLGNRLGLQVHPLYVGLNALGRHQNHGHLSYLMGNQGVGWWYYFPVAFAVKTPVTTLIVLIVVACQGVLLIKRPSLPVAVAICCVASLLAAAAASQLNIGIRHILPLYPFLFAILACGVNSWPRRAVLGVAALLVIESTLVYPDYTAFFNVAVGGPDRGPNYLLDSNIDWGQDLIKLKHWMNSHAVSSVCNVYFGTAALDFYQIDGPEIPKDADDLGRSSTDCFAAISVTPLYGLYVQSDPYRWLRAKEPVAKVGHSIYVYDLSKANRPKSQAQATVSFHEHPSPPESHQ
jgi:hypothetical protein